MVSRVGARLWHCQCSCSSWAWATTTSTTHKGGQWPCQVMSSCLIKGCWSVDSQNNKCWSWSAFSAHGQLVSPIPLYLACDSAFSLIWRELNTGRGGIGRAIQVRFWLALAPPMLRAWWQLSFLSEKIDSLSANRLIYFCRENIYLILRQNRFPVC